MELNTKTKIYLGMLVLTALSFYGYLLSAYSIESFRMFLFWAFLAIVVESLLIPMPNNTVGVSVGYAVNIAAIIVGGPLLATTIVGLGFLLRAPKIEGRGYVHVFNLPAHKSLFNVTQSVIVTALMSIFYLRLGGDIGQFNFFATAIIVISGAIFNS